MIAAGGKPSKGTSADKRLGVNKTKAAPDPGGRYPTAPTKRTPPPAPKPKPKPKKR